MNTKELLRDILRCRRGFQSSGEVQTIHKYVDSVPGMQSDGFGNRYLQIGETTKTIISCHTDTVHTIDGMQSIVFDEKTEEYSLNKDKLYKAKPVLRKAWVEVFKSGYKKEHKAEVVIPYTRNCLGADDGAGMYTALRMIEAKVPALYVFHRGEEKGGLGSAWIDKHDWRHYIGYQRCIAIDRRGRTDIITKQRGSRCCSNTFAEELALRLDMKHKPCPYGSFTDSANYVDIVPECTNISAGYQNEHGEDETLYVPYLEELIDSLCSIDFESLPTVRDVWEDNKCAGDPPEPEPEPMFWGSYMVKGRMVNAANNASSNYPGYIITDNRRFGWEKDPIEATGQQLKEKTEQNRKVLLLAEKNETELKPGTEHCLHVECRGWTGCLYDSFGWE